MANTCVTCMVGNRCRYGLVVYPGGAVGLCECGCHEKDKYDYGR